MLFRSSIVPASGVLTTLVFAAFSLLDASPVQAEPLRLDLTVPVAQPRLEQALAFQLQAPVLPLETALGQAPEPPSGLGFIIAGWIGVGVGTLNLATMPLCFTDFYEDYQGLCVGLSAGFAGVGLGVGIPFLIVGYSDRKKHKVWEDNQVAQHLERTHFSALPGGGVATYQLDF